jgi:hypothetical protein
LGAGRAKRELRHGDTTLTGGGVLYGQGTSPVQTTGAPSQYNVLVGGSGGVPQFGQVALNQAAAVTGSLGVANGGTGLTALTPDVIYRVNAASAALAASAFTDNGTLVSSTESPGDRQHQPGGVACERGIGTQRGDCPQWLRRRRARADGRGRTLPSPNDSP